MPIKTLIDGDVLCYRAGFSAERRLFVTHGLDGLDEHPEGTKKTDIMGSPTPPEKIETFLVVRDIATCMLYARNIVDHIVEATGCGNNYVIVLSTSNDTDMFRLKVAKTLPYKGNRKDFKRPYYYYELRDYFQRFHPSIVVKGIEADDYLAMNQTKKTCIASIDKDLLQVPGKHYNFVKRQFSCVTEFEGWRNFYTQMLTGDKADNIPGVPRYGAVTSTKTLAKCSTARECHAMVSSVYRRTFKDCAERFDEVAELCYLLRSEGDSWHQAKQKVIL